MPIRRANMDVAPSCCYLSTSGGHAMWIRRGQLIKPIPFPSKYLLSEHGKDSAGLGQEEKCSFTVALYPSRWTWQQATGSERAIRSTCPLKDGPLGWAHNVGNGVVVGIPHQEQGFLFYIAVFFN